MGNKVSQTVTQEKRKRGGERGEEREQERGLERPQSTSHTLPYVLLEHLPRLGHTCRRSPHSVTLYVTVYLLFTWQKHTATLPQRHTSRHTLRHLLSTVYMAEAYGHSPPTASPTRTSVHPTSASLHPMRPSIELGRGRR